MVPKTKLAQTLEAGRLAITAECLPPLDRDAGAIRKLAALLPRTLDAVVVADSPDQAGGSALAAAAILAGEKAEPVLSMVTRDRNRIALNGEVFGAAALGVGSILCLSGEHQSLGVCKQAAGAYDIDSIQFQQALRVLGETGVDLTGRAVKQPPAFFVGAVAHPYLRPLELNLIRLKKKVQAGAKFLLTQAVFDLAGFEEWMKAVRAAGIDKQAAILASVLPLGSVEEARRMAERGTYGPIGAAVIDRLAKASDPAREGVAICVEMAGKLKSVAGVRGIHILCGGCEGAAAAIIQEAHLASA
jgi:methylenetetrahydrofolate reductase (NADPH)